MPHFTALLQHLKLISCSLIAIGLGWTFAEVRRFFFHPGAFYDEAMEDYQEGRWISLVWEWRAFSSGPSSALTNSA